LPDAPLIRQARDEDAPAVARLIYLTSQPGYRLFAGDERRALRMIERAFADPCSDCARDVVTVAELDGGVAGAMAAFPASEGDERRRRFVRIAMRHRPPWRWPRIALLGWQGARHSPPAPPDSFYVDALSTAERFRRRGVAAALLGAAERSARELGLGAVALDTVATNTGARALYEGFGFTVDAEVAAAPPIPALVGYVKRVPGRSP
jgi:ribosomal protein S18 acetylase RimI-like enzyme